MKHPETQFLVPVCAGMQAVHAPAYAKAQGHSMAAKTLPYVVDASHRQGDILISINLHFSFQKSFT